MSVFSNIPKLPKKLILPILGGLVAVSIVTVAVVNNLGTPKSKINLAQSSQSVTARSEAISSPSSSCSSSTVSSSSSSSESSAAPIPVTTTPVIPPSIDSSKLGFVKSFANTVNTAPSSSEDSKVDNSIKPDFSQADVDLVLAESQKIIDSIDSLDVNDPKAIEKLQDPALSELSAKISKYQSEHPEEFEKNFPGAKAKMDELLSKAISKIIDKIMPKFVEEIQKDQLKGEQFVNKCKQNNFGYEYKEINYVFGSVYAKVRVFGSVNENGLRQIAEDIKIKCPGGSFTFYKYDARNYEFGDYIDGVFVSNPDQIGSAYIFDNELNFSYYEPVPRYNAEGLIPRIDDSNNGIIVIQ
jgi:hypothetical protein